MTTPNAIPPEPEYGPVDRVDGEVVSPTPKAGIPMAKPGNTSTEIVRSQDNEMGNMPQIIIKAESIGTLEMDGKAQLALDKELDRKDVLIRPDGLVYLPWYWYAKRLNEAFGRGRWGLVPSTHPLLHPVGTFGDQEVMQGWWLFVKGTPIGFSYGECTFRSNNSGMTFADACEGTKSIALTRICKGLGMTLELWDAEWGRAWKAEFAESRTEAGYTDRNGQKKGKDKLVWHKLGTPWPSELQQPTAPAATQAQQVRTPAPVQSKPATPVAKPTTAPVANSNTMPAPSAQAVANKTADEEKKHAEVDALNKKSAAAAAEKVKAVKVAWINAAVEKHIMATITDEPGSVTLKKILGVVYDELAGWNADISLTAGLEKIQKFEFTKK